jgi:hypothetical protein
MADDECPEVELARGVVAKLAPEELPLFSAVVRKVKADPKGNASRDRGEDDILGFGSAEAAEFITPIVLMMTKEVVALVVVDLLKATIAKTRDEAVLIVRRWIRGEAPEIPPDPARHARARATAENKAVEAQLPKARAEALADACVQWVV